ncbi:MAG: hypothetical protein AAGF26_14680 [Cyanobacteria bacterium P01_G01_bin.49]
MEEWNKEFMEWLGTVTVAFEDFVDEVSQVAEETAGKFQDDLVQEVDQFIDDLLVSVVDISIEEEINLPYYLNDESDWLVSPKIEPTFNVHPACRGCEHYHGRVHGKNLLVCAMHPYGWYDLHCPDWEGENQN